MKISYFLIATLLVVAHPTWAQDRYQSDIPQATVSAFENARSVRRTGDLAASVTQLKTVIANQPDYYLATYNLALALTDLKEFKEAETWYLKTIEIGKNKNITDYSLYNSFGWMYLVAGDFVKAEEYFNIALANVDKIPTLDGKRKLYNNAGLNYIYQRKYKKAEELLKIAQTKYQSSTAVQNLQMLDNIKARSIPTN